MADVIQLLTVPQAAQALSLSKAKVYQLITQGSVPIIKIGRATRIEREALHGFIREQATASRRTTRGA